VIAELVLAAAVPITDSGEPSGLIRRSLGLTNGTT